jgi:hypothetical protein
MSIMNSGPAAGPRRYLRESLSGGYCHGVGVVRLGIDLGTSNTAAVLEAGDGTVQPVLFDGSELLPSAVFLGPDGGLLTGRDALHAARAAPDRFEPHPKRCVDDRMVLLGGVEVPVLDLLAAPLRRVAVETRWDPDVTPGSVTLTCPAGWGATRRSTLAAAAWAAGLGRVRLVAEPVAAAAFHLARSGEALPPGARVVVYDFGAGTFDASVVRRTRDGFEVLATGGLPDVGGLDIDAAVMDALGATYAVRDEALWTRLARPVTAADRRARLVWQQDVRTAKELLSRASSTTLFVPLFDDTAVLGRPELEQIAGPVLAATVRATRSALAAAGPAGDVTGNAAGDVAAVLFVGGSSRMPLAATMVHQAFGVAPTVVERPELIVAEGALAAPGDAALPFVAPVSLTKPVSLIKRPPPVESPTGLTIPVADALPAEAVAPVDDQHEPVSRVGLSRRGGRLVAAALALVLAAAAAVAVYLIGPGAGDRGALEPVTSPTPSTPATTAPAAVPAAVPSLPPEQCLIGTWRATRQTQTLSGTPDIASGIGHGGSVYTFRPDGILLEDHSAATPVTGAGNATGATYTETTSGTTTSRYAADAWRVTFDVVTSTEVDVLRRNNTVTSRYHHKPGDHSQWTYTCAGTELELCAGELPTIITFSRPVAPPGAPSALRLPSVRQCY